MPTVYRVVARVGTEDKVVRVTVTLVAACDFARRYHSLWNEPTFVERVEQVLALAPVKRSKSSGTHHAVKPPEK